jgi:ADP-ribose pyrophosphatase
MRPDGTRTAWRGRLFDVVVERWGRHERELVDHPGSVAVVAVDADDRVVLVRQRREAARAELLELPAGTCEEGEDALTTARRELAEETGLHGGRWEELAAVWTSPGFVRERMTIFRCTGAEEGDPAAEEDESIELVRIAVAHLPGLVATLEDAKTAVGLLLLLRERGL